MPTARAASTSRVGAAPRCVATPQIGPMLPGPRHGHVADALTQSNFKSGPPAGFLHPHAVALGVRPGSAATSLDHTDKAIGGAAHRPLRSARQDVLGPDGRGWVDPVK